MTLTSGKLTGNVPWTRKKNVYLFPSMSTAYNVRVKEVAQYLQEKVRKHGNRIFVCSYKLGRPEDTWELRAVSAVQLDEPIVHIGLCLGDNVAFLATSTNTVQLFQAPSSLRTWDMCEMPFTDVDLAVRIVIDTVLRCQNANVGYNCHLLENIEHMLCRLLMCSHDELDNHTNDYAFDSPETWCRGVHCSQLVLLVLKRCVERGALEIADPKHKQEFMNVYSHTCLPNPLYRLIDRIWQPSHQNVEYTRQSCALQENMTELESLLDDTIHK